MSRTRCCCACLLVLAAVALAPAASRAEDVPSAGRKVALLIGVSRYDNGLRRLRYAERDAEELAETLVTRGYERRDVRVMTSGADRKDARKYPSTSNIRRALDELLAGGRRPTAC